MIVNDLQQALLKARKEKSDMVETLSMLFAQVKLIGKNNGNRETTDEEAIAFLTKTKKANIETSELAKKINRSDIIGDMNKQNALIDTFLPQQLSEQELIDIVNEQVSMLQSVDKKAMGTIMSYLKKNYGGQYDGKVASMVVKNCLG